MLESGEVVNFARAAKANSVEAWLPPRLTDILKAGPEGLAVTRALVERVAGCVADDRARLLAGGGLMAPGTAKLLAPIPEPSMILAIGLAYKSHLAEMSNTPAPPHPSAFLKIPASINGPDAPIHVPPQAPGHIDFEGELAIVIGRTCHNVSPADAMDYVVGYTVCNDVSARDWVQRVWSATTPWESRWSWEVNIMGKSLPGFTPIGPVITTADEIGDPSALKLTTRLNGNIMQSAEVSDMIFPLAEVVSYFSRWYTFQPGDIITTGTPAGVGVGRKPPVFMKAGDTIEVEISKIGVLRNFLVESANQPHAAVGQ
jgi:2-keto-4-pentenoate hydratase/2-oxohepta-3-ene-1,7-dioic acid hydratase in catechol pathway